MADRNAPIGVFDSGVGGISTLGAMIRQMPGEKFVFYGDIQNAPYGIKTTEEVTECVYRVVDELEKYDIKALVIACNTATGAAAEKLRKDKTYPIIGIEPALKIAHDAGKEGTILVLATPLALRQAKFISLMERYGENAIPVPCDGLMELVEREDTKGAEKYLRQLLSEWETDRLAAVVLGCTHYVFLRHVIRAMLPESVLITDGNLGTARQLERVLHTKNLLCDENRGEVIFRTSGNESIMIPHMERMLRRALTL